MITETKIIEVKPAQPAITKKYLGIMLDEEEVKALMDVIEMDSTKTVGSLLQRKYDIHMSPRTGRLQMEQIIQLLRIPCRQFLNE